MNPVQPQTDFIGKVKEYWKKITGQENFFNELGIGLIICLIAIGFLIVILIKPNEVKQLTNKLSLRPVPTSAPTPTPTNTPTPTPTPWPIAKGPQEYKVMTKENPQIKGFKISEFDPKEGQNQTMTVSVADLKNVPITKVEVELKTDHKTKIYSLSLSSGSNTDGEWSATWITDDTHNYIYTANFTVTNQNGDSSVVQGHFR